VVAVSEPHAPLLRREAELFNSLYPGAHVEVQARSTREALIALVEDSVQMAAVDRAPTAQEQTALERAGVHTSELRMGEDALGVFVHPANRLRGLTCAQVGDVLTGRTNDWVSLPGAGLSGRIYVVLTGRNSGVCELLATVFFPNATLAPSQVAATEAEVLQKVLADPNAIGVASVAAWKDPGAARGVRIAASGEPGWTNGISTTSAAALRALDALVADSTGTWVAHPLHQANVHRGVYPFHFSVLMLFDPRSALAAGFGSFVASAPGQKLVLAAGLVPATMPVRLVTRK
jgi:phosphate transport system substrate-binding protein